MTEQAPLAHPTCYRHPDRTTYVRCARCDRPICPDCMTPAAVGFQCPECVSAGARSVPGVRTPFGGKAIDKPYVSYGIAGLCALIYVWQWAIGINPSAAEWGMQPAMIAAHDEYYRLITSAFLHGSILHILFNMYILIVLGPTLERVLGHARFLALYLLSALGGSVASYWFSPFNTVSVGASGAIFGLMGALVVAGRKLSYDISQVLALIAINVVIGFVVSGVDWRAHLGGLITGAGVAALMVYAPRHQRALLQWAGAAAVFAVLAALVLARSA